MTLYYFDPVKDDSSSASKSEDKESRQRTVITPDPAFSTTPSARPTGPTALQTIDRVDEDGVRGSTIAASKVQGDRGRVTNGNPSVARTASLRSSTGHLNEKQLAMCQTKGQLDRI